MALIPSDFIDDLLSRTDIVETIQQHLTLKKAGANFVACCPFHHEKTPSFNVSPSKQIYKCFGCGASGNIISFIMEYEHLTFPETIEQLAEQHGLSMPNKNQSSTTQPHVAPLYDTLEQCNRFYQLQLRRHSEASIAIEYLKQRGITGETAQRFQVGFAPRGWDNLLKFFKEDNHTVKRLLTTGMAIKNEKQRVYDRFRHRILFPIRNRTGKTIGFGGRAIGDEQPKYLNSPETPVFHKGRELYGMYEARKASALTEMVIVEGYMDVLSLAQHGITQVVATLGTAVTKEHVQLLFRYTSKLIFCFDGDAAGRKAAWRALEQSLAELHEGRSVRFMFLPEGEDPDSLVQAQGQEGFKQAQQQAQDIATFLFEHIQQHINTYAVDQQAELIQTALPFINQIPNAILQELLLEQLAQQAKLSRTQLQPWVKQAQPATLTQQKNNTNIALSPLRTTISILLQHPTLAATLQSNTSLHTWLQQSNLTGEAKLIKQIYERCLAYPDIHTSQLIERWRNHPGFDLVTQLAEQSFPSDAQLAQQLVDALHHHIQYMQTQSIETLLAKGRQQSLTPEEQHQLQALIRAQKQTKSKASETT